jgi:molybdenum cofactor cytidylyltransferase
MIHIGHEKCPQAAIVPVINKIDLAEDTQQIRVILQNFPCVESVDRLLFTIFKGDLSVPFSFSRTQCGFEPEISVVILAAGASVRMGQPKLALTLKRKTLLELALDPILAAGIRDIVVVTDEDPTWIKKSIPPEVRIAVNLHSCEGIATSLQVGINAVSRRSQAIFFSLGDQPLITPEVYRSLIEHYHQYMKSLTFPVFEGKRGNPALFDRRLWRALMALQGDEGGKQIIASIPGQEKEGVPVSCPGILMDVDTPEDYVRMRGMDANESL